VCASVAVSAAGAARPVVSPVRTSPGRLAGAGLADVTADGARHERGASEVQVDRDRLASLEPFATLIEAPGEPLELPAPFARLVPRLALPGPVDGRPPLVTNFVVSLNGTVRLSDRLASSRLVALGSDHDWFLLGLLRTLAAAIVIGAEPVRVDRGRQDGMAALRGLAGELRTLRESLGLGPLHHVVLSASGNLPSTSPVWDAPATGVTSPAGADALAVPAGVEVVVDEHAGAHGVSLPAAVDVARARAEAAAGAGTASSAPARPSDARPVFVLGEPGPGLFAALLRQQLVDELFLTLSPLLAGPAPGRLELMGGPAYASLSLVGMSRAGSHLYSRWRPVRSSEHAADVLDG
jgi:riboflavin biosynthesis pyrimidine reductase